MVQRADFIVAIACVPCGPRRSLIYACAWGFWVCWKLSAAEQIKPDCCRTPAVVSIFTDSAACVLAFYASPLHYIIILRARHDHNKIANWIKLNNNRLACSVAFYDLSAAFDTLDHQILLKRLNISYGIHAKAFQWLSSDLSDRQQSVTLRSISSKPVPLQKSETRMTASVLKQDPNT